MKTLLSTLVIFGLLQGCGDGSAVNALPAVANNVPACSDTKQETTETGSAKKAPATASEVPAAAAATSEVVETKAAKLTMDDCVDPDLSLYPAGKPVTLCNGTLAYGGFVPAPVEPAKPACSRNGQTDCVANNTYAANNNSNLKSEDLKSGVTVAGVTGTYAAPVYENCSRNGQVGCLATAQFPANDVTGLVASNLRSGVTVAGVAGSFNPTVESHSDCSASNQVGCVTTASFKSIEGATMALITAGNIRSGVTIAGVTGSYPSASTPLVGATATADLDAATFDARIKSVAQFEYFDSAGNRYAQQGSSAIASINIRDGITIFGATGSLGATVSPFDIRKGVTVNGTAGLIQTNCRNGDPAATDDEKCNALNWLSLDGGTGELYQDRNSGRKWFKLGSGMNHTTAKNLCTNLSVDGGGWRLPNPPELQQALLNQMDTPYVTGLRRTLADQGYLSGPYVGAIGSTGGTVSILTTDTNYKAVCIK
jgi:hypothetical protein